MTLPRTPSQTVGPFYALGLCRRREDDGALRFDIRMQGERATVFFAV